MPALHGVIHLEVVSNVVVPFRAAALVSVAAINICLVVLYESSPIGMGRRDSRTDNASSKLTRGYKRSLSSWTCAWDTIDVSSLITKQRSSSEAVFVEQ